MIFPIKDKNPTESRPILTVGLIALNLGIFIYTYFSGSFHEIIAIYGMRPAEIMAGERLFTLLTSMFLHGGWLHVIGNIWFLWIFGDNIEDYLGKLRFLFFYFGVGYIASMAHAYLNSFSNIPTIGASGAIAGVLGAYLVKYPRAKVYTLIFFFFFTIVEVPAFAFLGGWIGIQVLSGTLEMAAGVQGPTAYWAHIGGFVGGVLLIFLLGRKREKKH